MKLQDLSLLVVALPSTLALPSLQTRQGGSSSSGTGGRGGGSLVQIDAGPLIGVSSSLPTTNITKFLGIPYAAPPKRFQPPSKPEPWTSARDATTWGPSCIQQFDAGAGQNFTKYVFNDPAPRESEDCLFLNVYTRSEALREKGKTVMVWIQGGAFKFGSASQVLYDGSYLAGNEDVVVVTLNYRVGVFGFPAGTKQPAKERNLGLLDQRLALDWVQRDIEKFGGDPKQVTIFGESAGAVSVDALITSYGPDSHPPFRAGILQSGQTSYYNVPQNTGAAVQSFRRLAAAMCGNGTDVDALECLSDPKISASKIKAAAEIVGSDYPLTPDNETYVGVAGIRRKQKQIARVPVLVGHNAGEGRLYAYGQNDFEAFLNATIAPAVGQGFVQSLLQSYIVGGREFPTGYDAISQVITDFVFGCNGGALYAKESAAADIPTWRYLYNASFPNTSPWSGAGAFHSSEIRLVFGTFGLGENAYSKLESTPEQKALSRSIQKAWAGFAKDPTAGPGWQAVEKGESHSLAVFQASGETSTVNSTRVDWRCPFYTSLYEAISGISQIK